MQVESESQVLDALALWVQARPGERSKLFEDMFGEPCSFSCREIKDTLNLVATQTDIFSEARPIDYDE